MGRFLSLNGLYIREKILDCRLVLYPIKHSCSCFKRYISISRQIFPVNFVKRTFSILRSSFFCACLINSKCLSYHLRTSCNNWSSCCLIFSLYSIKYVLTLSHNSPLRSRSSSTRLQQREAHFS